MGKIVGSILEPFTGARATQRAGEAAAQQQSEAARLSAQAAAFRPVGMTTRFGRSTFDVTDIGGIPRVTGAGYEISPELAAIQNALFGLTGGAVGTAQEAATAAEPLGAAARSLFNLGTGYMAESPEVARQRIFDELQAARNPARIQEEQRLASSVFGRGRAGLSVSGMGQPELYSLAQAREAQRAQDIVAANQQAQQQLQFGTGLFGTGASLLGTQYAIPTQALGPLQSLLGTVGTIEEMGQQPFQLGLAVGGAAQPGATAAANLLGTGLSQAAQTRFQGIQAGNAANANFLAGLMGAGSNIYGMNQMANAYASRQPTMFLGG